MAFTQAQRDALAQAIANRNGMDSIQFDDQSVKFMSVADALALLAQMDREIAAAAGRSGVRYAATSKGL